VTAASIAALDSPAVEFMKHDPWPFIGFALLAGGNFLYFHMFLKLQKVGASVIGTAAQWKIPLLYVREASQRGWSPWLAYLTTFLYAAGAAFIVYGLFHLYD
jgi:hypothetical protein